MIVVDHDDQRVGSAVLTDAFECTKNVYGIEDVIEKNVVERFIQLEFFRIAHHETQVRVLALRDFDHGATDLYPDAIGWFERSEEVAGLAADFENPHPRLDNELENALEPAIKVSVGANVFFAAIGDGFLMLAPRFTDFIQSIWAPTPCRTDLGFQHNHCDPPCALPRRASSLAWASFMPGANRNTARYAPSARLESPLPSWVFPRQKYASGEGAISIAREKSATAASKSQNCCSIIPRPM